MKVTFTQKEVSFAQKKVKSVLAKVLTFAGFEGGKRFCALISDVKRVLETNFVKEVAAFCRKEGCHGDNRPAMAYVTCRPCMRSGVRTKRQKATRNSCDLLW